jgi:hypothetical protein
MNPRLRRNPQLGGARGEAHRGHQRSDAVVGPAQPGHDPGADERPARERPENGDELPLVSCLGAEREGKGNRAGREADRGERQEGTPEAPHRRRFLRAGRRRTRDTDGRWPSR